MLQTVFFFVSSFFILKISSSNQTKLIKQRYKTKSPFDVIF